MWYSFIKTSISKEDADKIFGLLSELEYTNTLKTEEGDVVTIPREMMYFGDEAVEYPYANLILDGSSWKNIDFLLELKKVKILNFIMNMFVISTA